MKARTLPFPIGLAVALVVLTSAAPAVALELERSLMGSSYGWVASSGTWLTGNAGQAVLGDGDAGSTELGSGFWPGYGGFAGGLHVEVYLPATLIHPGEAFWVRGWVFNDGPPRDGVPIFFILDVYDELWFWPSWAYYAPPGATGIDYELVDLGTGYREIPIVPEFVWPETGTDSASGLYFYGACLTPDMTAIDGDWAAVEWGFGP